MKDIEPRFPGSEPPRGGLRTVPGEQCLDYDSGHAAVAANVVRQEGSDRVICLNKAEEAEPSPEGEAQPKGANECTTVEDAGAVLRQRTRNEADLIPRPLAVPREKTPDCIYICIGNLKYAVAGLDLRHPLSLQRPRQPRLVNHRHQAALLILPLDRALH